MLRFSSIRRIEKVTNFHAAPEFSDPSRENSEKKGSPELSRSPRKLFRRRIVARQKLHIKKDDMVVVLSGQDRGKEGVVLEVYPKKQRAIVEGVHIVKRHLRPNQMGQGGVVEREGTIHVSNLKKIDA
jgi:large subunit ribosomal protein L24